LRVPRTAVGLLQAITLQLCAGATVEMCSGSETGSYLRLTDVLYHSALGLRVINKKKKQVEWLYINSPANGTGQGQNLDLTGWFSPSCSTAVLPG